MILNPNKTKDKMVSKSRTVNPPHGDVVLSEVSICATPNIDILGEMCDSRLTFDCSPSIDSRLTFDVRGIASRVSQRIGILRLVNRVFVDISLFLSSLLLCICSLNPSVLFSGVWVCRGKSSSDSRAPSVFGGQDLH